MQKVLIITYYWPPAGGPGVQRWLKFVKYFEEFGIEPVVFVPENPTYPILDETLLKEVPNDIKIVTLPIFEPYAFAAKLSKQKTKTISSGIIKTKKQSLTERLLLYIRGNCFIPDARKFWVKPSVKYLSTLLQENAIDTIITTGPPHSLHLIGLSLKERLGIKWIADFRDPWTTIGYHSKLKLTNSSKHKHKLLEKRVLQTADAITVTSFTTQKEFKEITNKRIITITNGFDIEICSSSKLSDKFTIAHIGSLLSNRNPIGLWRVLGELIKENEQFSRDFELILAGEVSDEVINAITNAGLFNYLIKPGYISHKEAIELQRTSQLLLLIEIDSEKTKGIIPGKLFEYMVSGRPILAIGPEGWDASVIINETDTGISFLYKQHHEIKKQILVYYALYKKQQLLASGVNLNKYSRKTLTGKMAEVIANL